MPHLLEAVFAGQIRVGDAELRAGLSEVRRLIDGVPARARDLTRVIGR